MITGRECSRCARRGLIFIAYMPDANLTTTDIFTAECCRRRLCPDCGGSGVIARSVKRMTKERR